MSNKLFMMEISAKAFLTQEENENEDFVAKSKEFFGVSDLEEKLKVSLTLESFLYQLCQKVEAPRAPLKMKIHEAWLTDVALRLAKTEEEENEPVSLLPSDQEKIVDFVSDEEKWANLEVLYKVESETKAKVLSLPAMNLIRSKEFIDELAKVFP
jgi:hypothetical protein